MRRIPATLALCAVVSAAVAQPRPATTAMTCQQTKALIVAHGAIVLTTGPYTYDLYVRDQGFCPAAKIADWNAFEDALAALTAHQTKALGALDGLARRNPDAPVFQTTYARALKEAGQGKG